MGIEHEVIENTVDGDGSGIRAGKAAEEIVSPICLPLLSGQMSGRLGYTLHGAV